MTSSSAAFDEELNAVLIYIQAKVFEKCADCVSDIIATGRLKEILGSDPKKFNDLAQLLTVEFWVLSLHWIDRIAHEHLADESRFRLMDKLVGQSALGSSLTFRREIPTNI